ncbi:phosphatidylinositol-3-phosphatase [Martiniozyma asiatica (nom. inval.)]|nr:phosphatidylinositol-3-phosphatase [Martiniozyma asiatica]
MVATLGLKYAQTTEGYILQTQTKSDSCLLINALGQISVTDLSTQTLTTKFTQIFGLLGVIHLYSDYYLLVVDEAESVGQVYGDKTVYKVKNVNVIPLSGKKADDEEDKYLEILNQHLNNATLYFSYGYDLTKQFKNQLDGQIDNEFMWNYFVSRSLISSGALDYVLPVIYGYAHFVNSYINSTDVTFGLITRRSRFRAGTRYFRRGIDKDGKVANFNETEQIFSIKKEKTEKVYSYLQIRGSVPVFWAEMNCLTYKPKLLLGVTDYLPTRKHFDKTITKYGTHYLVNLVNQSGYEKPVKLAYENAVTALNDSNIKYTYFDFHHECSKMRWDRVKILLDHLVNDGLSQNDYSLFTVGDEFVAEKIQTHVVRTNCMDCLDRTNVVQSMLARWYLQKQLIDAGIIDGVRDWKDVDPKFNLIFQNMWADNADYVSNSYSGTGALKTDYTRTGKRTKQGALQDLQNSITRYIKNNYYDGSRQDGYDLFLGNALPYETPTSPFKDQRPVLYQMIPYFLLVSLAIILVTLLLPNGSLLLKKNVIALSMSSLVTAISTWFMIKNGLQFVNWPALIKLDFLTKQEVYDNGKVEGYLFKKEAGFDKFQGTKKE